MIVFTTDATANPMDAVGILDASHSGGDHQGGGGDGPRRRRSPARSRPSAAPTSTIGVTDGAMSGQPLDVKVTPQTSFGGEDGNGDGNFGLTDISAGDSVVVYTPNPTPRLGRRGRRRRPDLARLGAAVQRLQRDRHGPGRTGLGAGAGRRRRTARGPYGHRGRSTRPRITRARTPVAARSRRSRTCSRATSSRCTCSAR